MTEPEGTLPAALLERLRAAGASDTELERFAAEHADLPYYQRFLAATQGGSYDDMSVGALLAQTRERWRSDRRAQSAFVDGAVGAPPEEQPVRTDAAAGAPADAGVPVPQAGAAPAASEEQLAAAEGQPVDVAQQVVPSDTGQAADQPPAVDEDLKAKVPSGTRDVVLDWVEKGHTVDDRRARAAAALAVEQDAPEPRSTLVDALEKQAR